jgi:hypothetical protein
MLNEGFSSGGVRFCWRQLVHQNLPAGTSAGDRAGQSIRLVLSLFWGGVMLEIMLAEEYVPPTFTFLKISWCHGVLVCKGTIYLL